LEICDDIDNDCDGDIDDADSSLDETTTPIWYADADGDGYGIVFYSRIRCEAPTGYVADDTDCDDLDEAINPGATEVCDEDAVDEDCDGAADDADPDVDMSTGTLFYVDVDGDGFGDLTDEGSLHCADPSSEAGWYSDEATDCDDDNAAISPEAIESCNGVDDNCDGSTDEAGAEGEGTWYADTDGDGYGVAGSSTTSCSAPDGYVLDGTDCDDTRSAISPEAIESCNGVDDNCDGSIDEAGAEGEGTWYADADGDGYGSAASTIASCSVPVGYVLDGTDCDDTRSAVSPEGTETCNGVDDNCDGSIDEAGAEGEGTWYADADGDGYGSAASTTASCSAPDGYVLDGTDCDDTRSAVSPEGTETCNGVDDNCDGSIDEAGAEGEGTWYADGDGDGYGSAASSTASCSAPDGYVLDGTDCDDTRSAVSPGATETCNGVDDDCNGSTDESSAVDASTWYVDSDGDGYGNPDVSIVSCSAPSGYVADGTDCDDDDGGSAVTGGTGSTTFNYTGGSQTFTVPSCVTSVLITAYGAEGRKATTTGSAPGRGGMARGDLSVSTGEVLYVYVGGNGGFNGGGASWSGSSQSCGGGGATDVRRGGTGLSNRVIVAGGGGGVSGESSWGNGGHGGGGSCGTNYCGGETGHGYGSGATSGGASGGSGTSGCHGGSGGGGGYGSGGSGAISTCYGTATAGSGTFGSGGAGASTSAGCCEGFGAAGGGGGYYGGGGVAGGCCGGGGAGGGSSWTGTLGSPAFSAGARSGNGTVTISW
jgi:hypothetical protein